MKDIRDSKHILIVKNRAMGDAIIGLSTIQYLRKLLPHHKITYAVPAWVAPLFSKVKVDCHGILPLHLKTLKGWFSLYKEIERREIDYVFEMFQSGRTRHFFNLLWHVKGIPYTFHNHHGHNQDQALIKDQGVIKEVIQRDLDGAWSHFARIHGDDCPSYLDYPPQIKYPSKKKNQIVFGVVATRQTKMWDLKNYKDLSTLLKKKNPSIEIIIPLSTSTQDMSIKKELEDLKIEGKIIQIPLSDLPEHLGGSLYYIGNDTGLKHLCVSLGIRTHTLFGPEPPKEWHPYHEKDHSYSYLEDLDCRTEKAHFCGLSSCDHLSCLKHFTAEDVLKKIEI